LSRAREGSVLHPPALSARGFIIGRILTALVLILNSAGSFQVPFGPLRPDQYFETLVKYVSAVGAVSGVGLLAFLDVGGGRSNKGRFVDKLGTVLFFLSVAGFMGALPLVLARFSRGGALVVSVLELTLLAAYFIDRRISVHSSHRASPP
jgi:hypothetical protein